MNPTSSTEKWTAIGAIATVAGLVFKKLFTRKPIENRKPKFENDLITRAEFHQSQDATRDRMTATFMALGEQIQQNQKEVLSALAHQGVIVEQRLDKIETTVARLDERTK